MTIFRTIFVSALLLVFVSADDTPLTLPDVDDSEMTSMYARDIENEVPAMGFGAKYMTGMEDVYLLLKLCRRWW
jgi:hypothetical protein